MAFALLALLLLASGSRADIDWDLEARILDTVQTVADVVANQTFLLVDAYFGLSLAEAQMRLLLDWVWANEAEQCPIGQYIASTEEKLSRALQASEAMRDSDDPLWTLTKPDLWEIAGHRAHVPLKDLDYTPQATYMEDEDMIEFAMQGTPVGEESDRCILGLLHTCAVSPRCWHVQSMMKPPPRGYPLTHRLLFFLTARQLDCEYTPSFANISINAKIRDLCGRILADSKAIQSLDYPPKLRDLFTEEITLCGMEGFREFTNREWIERILSWRSASGCFPQNLRRRKRNDYVVDNCSLHFSGLAAGALSVALRNMLEDTTLTGCMKDQ